jgi:hypothetical protein
MELFIRVKDGQPLNHPIMGDNFRQAFPDIDTENLPAEFARFVRVEPPAAGFLEIYEGVTYEFIDGVYTDVHHIRPMTTEEKTARQQEIIADFNQREYASNWSSWTFDEATYAMVPPIPRPEPDQAKLDQRIFTFWCGADANWKDTPVCPEGVYKFDFIAWVWVAQ